MARAIRNAREYFYHIDVHGQLFLKETVPKNLTSCFKDVTFLNFFFDRLKINAERPDLFEQGYQYVSPCGKEMNYVHAEDAPIVFHDLKDFNLIYAGSRSIPWDPRSLKVSLCTGRLYHPIPMALLPPWAFEKMLSNNRHPLNKVQGDKWRLGLLKSSLITSKLAKGLSMDDKGASLEWNQETFPIECF